MIKDRDGEPINVGGGVREQRDGSLLITGDVKWETKGDETIVTYAGKTYKSTAEKPIVDHRVRLERPRGRLGRRRRPRPPRRRDRRDGLPGPQRGVGQGLCVRQEAGPRGGRQAAPRRGGRRAVRGRLGRRRRPRPPRRRRGRLGLAFPERRRLEGPEARGGRAARRAGRARPWGRPPRRSRPAGIRAKVCAADWDGDGRLDLLLGDFAAQNPDTPPPTPEEKAKQDATRAELEKVQARYRELIPKIFGETRVKEKEELDRVNKEIEGGRPEDAGAAIEAPAGVRDARLDLALPPQARRARRTVDEESRDRRGVCARWSPRSSPFRSGRAGRSGLTSRFRVR